MISTSNFRDTATIIVNHPTDRAAVERTAAAALRHGSRVSIVVEARGQRDLVCSMRHLAGGFFVTSKRGSTEHTTAAAALTTGLVRFDDAFADLEVTWPRSRRND